jgi:hypothetical protein
LARAVRAAPPALVLAGYRAEYPARPCVQFAYIDDVDVVFQRALAAGAEPIVEPSQQPWGDRVGGFHDPSKNRWWVAIRSKINSTSKPRLNRETPGEETKGANVPVWEP